MSKELTFSEATLGWRFSHTERFLTNFIEQWKLLQDVQIKNLDEFWDVQKAAGLWLEELGAIFHIPAPQIKGMNAFVLDIDKMDDEDVIMDGTYTEMNDDLYRKIIIIRTMSTMKLFCMKNIADSIEQALGKDNVKIEFRENPEIQGNRVPMYFLIYLTFKDPKTVKLFAGMQDSMPNVLIGKPMGISYDMVVMYDPNL